MKICPILSTATLLSVALAAPAARAETYQTCAGFIDAVPTVVSTQGVWCLRHDLATAITSGAAITVATNNVTIECNGFKIGGLSAGLATTADGVHADDRMNTTVRNCTLRGFLIGVNLAGDASGGHRVENNHLDGNTYTGIYVSGDGSTVRGNQVMDTGGSTTWSTNTVAIYTVGSTDVIDNSVIGVAPDGPETDAGAYGIATYQADGVISGNRIRRLTGKGAGTVHGIWNDTSARLIMSGNALADGASANGVGIRCTNGVGLAANNFINGFATAVLNCNSLGNVP